MPPVTEENVVKGFQAAGDRMTGIENSVQELVDAFASNNKQLKLLLGAGFREAHERHRSFWPTPDMAKAFGELVLQAMGRKAMGEGADVDGGVLVPDDLQNRIIQMLGVYGKFRRDATVLQMGSSRAMVPKVTSDLTVYCPGEGNEITDSDMTFQQLGMNARTFACLTKVSNELEQDAIGGIGEIIGISITRSLAKKEDLIGFIGDGTSTYFGMTGIVGALMGVDATIGNIAGLKVATGNAYSEITLGDFEGVAAILPEDVDETAKWYLSKKFYYNVVYPLVRTAGVASMFELLTDRKEKYFMGYEVVFVSAMPSTEANSQICAILGDLQMGAYLAERRKLTIDKSSEVFFANNQIGIRGIERIDITAFGVGDTNDPGAIIALITAAA